MLVIRIWNYFRGYVIIKIEGLTLERFINLAIAKGIYLWDIVRYDHTSLEAKVGIKGFKEIRKIVKRAGCRVTIKKKRGYPFIVHKLKYRKMLAFGFFIALGIVFFLTSFIWTIDVVGNEEVEDSVFINYLEKMDIKPGIPKYKVNIPEIKRGILTDIDRISFAHADIQGTKLVVEIKERDKVPEKIEEDIPCNVVAEKNAVIEKIVAKNGKSIVEKGDIVKEGDILITGFIEDERMENPLLVHSEGEVFGRTIYSKIIEEPVIKTIKEETGKVHVAREVRIFDKRVQLMSGDIPFKDYIENTKVKKVTNSLVDLPFEIVLHEYKEVNVTKVQQNVDALKEMISVKGVQQIMDELPDDAQVVSKDVTYSLEDNVLITNISIEVIEDIGRKEKIKFVEED